MSMAAGREAGWDYDLDSEDDMFNRASDYEAAFLVVPILQVVALFTTLLVKETNCRNL